MNCMNQDASLSLLGDGSLSLLSKEQAAVRDLQLVSAAIAGSSDAFATLEWLYSGHLFSTIVRITKNRADAEDALQDTLLRAYSALSSFKGTSSFYSWLTRIAINSALMILRKRRVRPEVSLDPCHEPEDDLPAFEVKDPGLNPEQTYDQHQRCVNIHSAIQKLHTKLRGPIQMRMAQEYSLKEIAQTLDITITAAKTRLHRARARLNASPVLRTGEEKQRASSNLRRKTVISGPETRELRSA